MRCSSLGVSCTTLTVLGPAFLASLSGWEKKGSVAPMVACRAIEARIAIVVGSAKMSKKFLRVED